MATKTNPRKDFVQVAHNVFQQASGEVSPAKPTKAQEDGKKGGIKGGAARAKKLTAEERSEIARIAALARWTK